MTRCERQGALCPAHAPPSTPPIRHRATEQRAASGVPCARPRGRRRARPRPPPSSGGGEGRFPDPGRVESQLRHSRRGLREPVARGPWSRGEGSERSRRRWTAPARGTGPAVEAAGRKEGAFCPCSLSLAPELAGPSGVGWGLGLVNGGGSVSALEPLSPARRGDRGICSLVGRTDSSVAGSLGQDGESPAGRAQSCRQTPGGVSDRRLWVSGFADPSRRMDRVTSNTSAGLCMLP